MNKGYPHKMDGLSNLLEVISGFNKSNIYCSFIPD